MLDCDLRLSQRVPAAPHFVRFVRTFCAAIFPRVGRPLVVGIGDVQTVFESDAGCIPHRQFARR